MFESTAVECISDGALEDAIAAISVIWLMLKAILGSIVIGRSLISLCSTIGKDDAGVRYRE